jgi:hypothetical protein
VGLAGRRPRARPDVGFWDTHGSAGEAGSGRHTSLLICALGRIPSEPWVPFGKHYAADDAQRLS